LGDLRDQLNSMTAQELIEWIAAQRPELSTDKVEWQLRDILQVCYNWLESNVDDQDGRI
jgi:hypothetical protein